MTLADLQAEIAAALRTLQAQIDGLQVYAYMNPNPTPPSLDVYPGDPFQTFAAFGGSFQIFFTVRARVSTADSEAGQKLLLRLLDTGDTASVERVLSANDFVVVPEGVSGFREYYEDAATNGRLLGCEWRVSAYT